MVLTRPFFYWIPREGDPVKIVHQIEGETLDYLPGKKILYLSWSELRDALCASLKNVKKLAMEYSPMGAIPDVSVVDGGTLDLIREKNIEVMSSADLLQVFTSILSDQQIQSHLEASAVIEKTLEKAWDFLTRRVREGGKVTEYDVQQLILSEFTANNCISEEGPTCSVNEHTAYPHYLATRDLCKTIEKGDFVLIDLWCKKNIPNGVYADITRVAILAPEPTPRLQNIFEIVKEARDAGIDLIRKKFYKKEELTGAAVDIACRGVIKKAGYGRYFTHRTGHNIDINVHGSGVHLDNLETLDERQILPKTCFSIEPGIYLKGEFGVRLETNLIIKADRTVEITGGLQEAILCLV